ncbi:stress response protein NST1-like [Mangifera indica]|uniref:stress response protein NST1-like n=1 Tax=Mangifera indica TaxID=29780 RepID=UPI001CFA451F|nr:stress response protein NST1-like [Mangifera indica]
MGDKVRRMTNSPHKAEILSSSLEAFKKIQRERASLHAANDAPGLKCSNCHYYVSDNNLTKSTRISDVMHSSKDSVMNSGRQTELTPGNSSGDKRNSELRRSSRVNFQNGRDPSLNPSFLDLNSSRPPTQNISAATGSEKSKREHLGSETEKLLPKKGKILTENVTDENLKPTDQLKRPIPLTEKEKRNATSWKSMDAWKEKRNWEDILSSPFCVSSRISHSPGMSRKSVECARNLCDKLMSTEKKKKTALDLKKEAEEKHARAMRIRNELENERVQKLQHTLEKLNRVNEWQAVRSMKLRECMYARHQRSELQHEAFLAQVLKRAGNESSKVNEVRFITSLNKENKKLMLRQKLHDSELRRAEKLQVLRTKQKEDIAREEAVLERRKLIEAEKLQRLALTQRKKEEAQVRREEERKVSSAAREARAIEQLRRKEERAKAQQEEAELLAQKLAEKLSESEQRRKFYLEQIRERASMDFRDHSSPLLRRSINKEGQGRFTPINNGDKCQANVVTGSGGSSIATGNVAKA